MQTTLDAQDEYLDPFSRDPYATKLRGTFERRVAAARGTTFDPKWLEKALARAVREQWCFKMNCTTCGATKMVELLTEQRITSLQTYRKAVNELSWERAEEVVLGLAYCGPETSKEAIYWMLYNLWCIWEERAHLELFPALEGTAAGRALEAMRVHYADEIQRRRIHEERQGVKQKDWVR